MRSLPCERYEFTLCDERTPQIRCIACHRSAAGALQIATGGQELKLWTQSATSSEQFAYAVHFLEKMTSCIVHMRHFDILYSMAGLRLISESVFASQLCFCASVVCVCGGSVHTYTTNYYALATEGVGVMAVMLSFLLSVFPMPQGQKRCVINVVVIIIIVIGRQYS